MNYESNLTSQELNFKLLLGLKKHLLRSQDTTVAKSDRLTSLNNIAEVLDYIILNFNDSIQGEERILLQKFFNFLLVKVTKARVQIHTEPMKFVDEIGFINIMLQ